MNSVLPKIQNPEQNNITDIHKNLTIYYSHPIRTYNSEREKHAIELLQKRFCKFTIVNPKDHSLPDMQRYLELEARCGIFAYHGMNETITKGVALEKLFAFIIEMPIYRIDSEIKRENNHMISYPESLISKQDVILLYKILKGLP